MSTDDRKYVRVYYNDLIRDYPEVWSNNDQLATWLRMLATADPMWPTPPELPRSVKARTLARLVDSSLVSADSGRFRMKGLDAERDKRSESGRIAAAMRWHGKGISDGNAEVMLNTNTSKAKNEPNFARESLPGDDGRADIEAYLLITRRAPTPRQRQLLDGVLAIHDLTGPQWSADIMLRHPDDPIGAVIAADKAWRAERIEEAKSQEVTKVIPHRPKAHGLTGINAELAALMREQEAKRGVAS